MVVYILCILYDAICDLSVLSININRGTESFGHEHIYIYILRCVIFSAVNRSQYNIRARIILSFPAATNDQRDFQEVYQTIFQGNRSERKSPISLVTFTSNGSTLSGFLFLFLLYRHCLIFIHKTALLCILLLTYNSNDLDDCLYYLYKIKF